MNNAEMVRMNLQSIIDDQKSVIDEQRTEIEQLRAELADARRQLQAGWIEVCQTSADLLQKDLAEKLAASQAREKVWIEALEWYAKNAFDGYGNGAMAIARKALALTAANAALTGAEGVRVEGTVRQGG